MPSYKYKNCSMMKVLEKNPFIPFNSPKAKYVPVGTV